MRIFVLPFTWVVAASSVAAASLQWPRAFSGSSRARWLALARGFASVVVSLVPTGLIMAVFIR